MKFINNNFINSKGLITNVLKNKEKINLLISQVVIAIIGLITGKIIAIYFTPDDFGEFNLQFALYTFFFSLLLNPFVQFVKTYTNTLLPKIGFNYFRILGISLGLLMCIVMYITILIKYPTNYYLYLIILLIIPINSMFLLLSDYFNIKNRLNEYSLINFIKVFVPLILLGGMFVYNYKYTNGIQYLWYFQVIGFAASSLLFISKYKFTTINSYQISFINFLKKYIKYSLPLIILAFWGWINNYFDRFAIEYFMDVKAVGIYNANFSVGSKFFLLLNPFFLTILTPKIYTNTSSKLKKDTIKKYCKYYTITSLPLLLIIFLFNDYIGILLLSKNYESGFYIIFWISVGYFLMTLSYLVEVIFYAEGKTKIILISNIFSAIANILLNIILIPKYGLNGALIATLISQFTRLLLITLSLKKL